MLSIIIPTYNEEKYLPRLLDSIKNQTYKDIEIIVADNNSTDKTRMLAKKAGVKVVSGGMPGEGRNSGAKDARGEWLFFFDSDVVLPPNFLTEVLAGIKNSNLEVATCFVEPLSSRKIDKFLHKIANYYVFVTQKFFTHASGACIFIKKDKHILLGGFNEKIRMGEDQDYISRASKIAKFGVLKNTFLPISVRRFDKDGRLKIIIKYLTSEFHLAFIGPVYSDVFNYKFGYPTKKLKNRIK